MSTGLIIGIVVVVIVVAIILWAISGYNNLVALRNCKEWLAQIDAKCPA